MKTNVKLIDILLLAWEALFIITIITTGGAVILFNFDPDLALLVWTAVLSLLLFGAIIYEAVLLIIKAMKTIRKHWYLISLAIFTILYHLAIYYFVIN